MIVEVQQQDVSVGAKHKADVLFVVHSLSNAIFEQEGSGMTSIAYGARLLYLYLQIVWDNLCVCCC